jgi:hypothetical protein
MIQMKLKQRFPRRWWSAAASALAGAVVVAVALFFTSGLSSWQLSSALVEARPLGPMWVTTPESYCATQDPQIIVYNRIPKAGSTTIITLLKQLSLANGFHLAEPMPYYDHVQARQAILDAIASGNRTVVCNHFNFPEILYGDRIAYVNVMRDPVERCTSEYYYRRYGDRPSEWKREFLEKYGEALLCGMLLDGQVHQQSPHDFFPSCLLYCETP